jgi:hypothetical protein
MIFFDFKGKRFNNLEFALKITRAYYNLFIDNKIVSK